jgi:hypothetical protein
MRPAGSAAGGIDLETGKRLREVTTGSSKYVA